MILPNKLPFAQTRFEGGRITPMRTFDPGRESGSSAAWIAGTSGGIIVTDATGGQRMSALSFNAMVWGVLVVPFAFMCAGHWRRKLRNFGIPESDGAQVARIVAWLSCAIPPILYLVLSLSTGSNRSISPYMSVGLLTLGGISAVIGFIACLSFLRGAERIGNTAACALSFALLCLIVLATVSAA